MFLADTEHKKFKPTEHGGFDVIDFVVCDQALRELERIINIHTLYAQQKEIVLIEFARNDYRRASDNLVIHFCMMLIFSTWMLKQISVKDVFKSVLPIQVQKMIFMYLNISSILTTPKSIDDPCSIFLQVHVILTIMVHLQALSLRSIHLLTRCVVLKLCEIYKLPSVPVYLE